MAIRIPANFIANLGNNLNPGGINVPSRAPAQQRGDENARGNTTNQRRISTQAELNFIPSDDSINTKVRSLLSDARQGRVADRGSIVNLLV